MNSMIPSPRTLPFVGSLFELEGDAIIQGLARMARDLGPIYHLTVLGNSTLILSGQTLVNEVCDESRFGKFIHSALQNLRPALGDALFTAHTREPNWELAHRILMPAFGPLGIREMFGRMLDVAHQMFDRWERFGDAEIDVADTMTRLTLDTLALCAFDYRFNSFYREAMHPFVDAMVETLVEAGARDRRPEFVSRAMLNKRRAFDRNIAVMGDMADALLNSRRTEGEVGRRGDLLDAMLTSADPVTGKVLPDDNIRLQLITFLIAGHETTSGLLSFAVHMLLEHPAEMEKARAAVDAVLGEREPTLESLAALDILDHVMMETLRLWPTAPAFAVTPHEPTELAGRYPVKPGDEILVLLPALHRDPTVWGEDADSFRPSRFEGGAAERLPRNSWKPFGNGQRACIGRGFALQEAKLVLAMLLQRFEIRYARPDYKLSICETLTMKPEGLKIVARRRTDGTGQARAIRPAVPERASAATAIATQATAAGEDQEPLIVLHGGNSGSSAAFARRLHADALRMGRKATILALDEAVDALPAKGTALIVAASYEGLPADNARRFVAWVEALPEGSLTGLRFGVLGCGNRQWARTYQAVPKRLDAALAAAGAQRCIPRGEADAAGDFMSAADAWITAAWQALGETPEPGEGGAGAAIVELPPLRQPLTGEAVSLRCESNVKLTPDGIAPGEAKHHLRFSFSAPATYRPGDYLAVLPSNPPEAVTRLLLRLGVDPDTGIVLDEANRSSPLPAKLVLSDLVELNQPVTTQQIRLFAARSACPPDRVRAEALLTADGASMPRTVDLLEQLPSCRVTLSELLSVLPPIAPRRYSIASSPRANPGACALTLSVVDRPAEAGHARHLGAASQFLARLPEGMSLTAAIVPGDPRFALPGDPRTPIVMIAAGSGIAPFRGFVEDRAIRQAQGEEIGPALLFFGCRDASVDWLHREEFAQWEARGVVDVRPAFSRAPVDGIRYVQDRLRKDADLVAQFVAAGAHVYVCGAAGTLVPGVEAALTAIAAEALDRPVPVAERWCRRTLVTRQRYAVDAFA